MVDMRKQFRAARRVSTPLVAVRTADSASAIRTVRESLTDSDIPLVQWDVMRGLSGINDAGAQAAAVMCNGKNPEMVSARPSDALKLAGALPEDSILFFHNAHRFLSDAVVMQGVCNLRDKLKQDGSMVILLMTSGAVLPAELNDDVFTINEPLPDAAALESIVLEAYENTRSVFPELAQPDKETINKAVDALLGMPAFPCEQSSQMCLDGSGLDLGGLWERKRQAIEACPGLSISRGGETFADTGGCGSAKEFFSLYLEGKRRTRGVIFVDEIEKAFAGAGSDSSGVKQGMLGTMLTWMQEHNAHGALFLGPPGTNKSGFSKQIGNTAQVPTVAFDLEAMQNSLVGASSERLRASLDKIDAITQGNSLWIATCNSMTVLPPELLRRFKLGTFFFDFPTVEGQQEIWEIWMQKFNVKGPIPAVKPGEPWTGSEIRNCCEYADNLGVSLVDAARYIVPVSVAKADELELLRQASSGKYLSAAEPGYYQYRKPLEASKPSRKVRDTDDGPKMIDIRGGQA